MQTLKKFRGVILQASKDGRMFVRIPYRGVYEVKPGDRIHHPLGVYVVSGNEIKSSLDKQTERESK